ncbi:MAG: hypothetical protein RL748_745, partial [Pseudomonadota bacterium]
ALAQRIGVAELSATIPEYCGAISKNPTIRANPAKVEAEEQHCQPGLLLQVVDQAVCYDVRELAGAAASVPAAPQTPQAGADDIIIDVRQPERALRYPLALPKHRVRHIPYYKLGSEFATLDQSKTYFLYCERGLMSQLQCEHLVQRGYKNVHVYQKGAVPA